MLTLWANGLALMAVGVALWPHVLLALGFTRHRSTVDDDPARTEPKECTGPHAEKFDQLCALGFKPLGRSVIRVGWSLTLAELMFISPEGDCAATITERSFNVCFQSVFEGGGVLVTGEAGDEPVVERGYELIAVAGKTLEEMLVWHRERAKERHAAGESLVIGAGLGHFQAISGAVADHPTNHATLKRMALKFVSVVGGVLAGVWFVACEIFDGTRGIL